MQGNEPLGLVRVRETRLCTRRTFFAILFLLALPLPCVVAAKEYAGGGSQACYGPALDDMYNGKFGRARRLLESCTRANPADYRALNYLAMTLLDQEMMREDLFRGSVFMNAGAVFHAQVQPLPAGFDQRINQILDKARSLETARLKKNPNDTDALYWLGVTHSRRAEFDFVLLRSYFSALHEGKAAYRINEKLLQLDPRFVDAYFVIGLGKYTIGMLPWYAKLVVSLAGVHGDVSEGIADLERVSHTGNYARVDAEIVLATVYEREKEYPKAVALLRQLFREYPQNSLALLEIARIQRLQDNWKAAAETYDAAAAKFARAQNPLIPRATILYRAGQAHEHLGEWQRALELYDEAGRIPGHPRDKYRAILAAARLNQRLNRLDEAKRQYQIVAGAVPHTDMGKEARRALRALDF